MAVSKKKKDWLKKSLAAERKQKRTDPEAFKKTLSKRREQVEDTKSKIKKKEEPTKTKKPTAPTPTKREAAPVTPKVDEPVRLNEPEPKKEQGILSQIWKPDIFKKLESEGRLHAGSLPIGIGAGVGGAKAIKVSAESMGKIRTALTNKAIVGKLVETGKGVRGVTAAKYATNTKSTALTKSFLTKIGGASALVGIIGSYPFAGFIKEEALQTLSFAVKSARDSGNLEDEQMAIDEQAKILDPSAWSKLLSAIPFANVVKELTKFYEAASTKLEIDQNSLNKRREEQATLEETGETPFMKERRESDEAARERELGYRAEDEEYFENLRKERGEEEERERSEAEDYYKRIGEERKTREEEEKQSEADYYSKIEEERKAADIEEMAWKAEYYNLIRLKRYAEAEELLAQHGG